MRIGAGILLFSLIFAPPVTPMAAAEEIAVSAAVSLREVVDELCNSFARKHPGVRFVRNYGGSGILARQIENGVPADVFIPASVQWMDYLKDRRLMENGTIGTFALNSLVFVGLPGRKVVGMRDVAELSSIAVGSPKSVPAGEYAMEALRNSGIDKKLEKKMIFARDVREALKYADQGEVDGAFVYRTDAAQARRAKVRFSVPRGLHRPIVYPLGVTKRGAANPVASAFRAYLDGYEARSLLRRYGFDLK